MTKLSSVELDDTDYTLKQKAVRNAYKLYDSQGEEIFSTKQKLLKAKEDFPFKDPDGNEIFRVKAQNIMDIAGDYAIIDSNTGNQVAVLEKEFTFLVHVWRIKDSEGREIAKITSRGKIIGLMRALSDIASLLPHKYTVEDSEDRNIGTIEGQFSITDTYEIHVDKDAQARELIVASCAVIDALEAN